MVKGFLLRGHWASSARPSALPDPSQHRSPGLAASNGGTCCCWSLSSFLHAALPKWASVWARTGRSDTTRSLSCPGPCSLATPSARACLRTCAADRRGRREAGRAENLRAEPQPHMTSDEARETAKKGGVRVSEVKHAG